MAGVKISNLPAAGALTGTELVAVVQGGITSQTTTAAVAGTTGVSTFSAGSTGLTPATATSGAVTLAGTLAVANGGTGVTTSTGTGSTVRSASPTFTGTLGAAAITASTTLGVTGTSTLSGNAIISVTDNTNAALRITQLGTGNALLVEDTTNPDSSPFVINNSGQLFQGYTSNIDYKALGLTYAVGAQQIAGADGNSSSQLIAQFSTSSLAPTLVFAKSKNATVGLHTTVSSGDSLGGVIFDGSDGTNFIEAARISAAVDGTPGTNDMPGRLVFSTTADGAATPTERMRINSSGTVSFPVNVLVGGPTSSAYAYGLQLYGTAANGSSNAFQWQYSVNTTGASLLFAKTRGASATDLTAAANGDTIGAISFGGSDGTAIQARGAFTGFIDGAVSAGNVPTAFSITTGTTSGTERMRITSGGLMGIGTGTPASCAIVDVTSTTLGFKFPVMTTTQKNAIGTPVAGLVIFDSTLAKLCVYSGSAWQTITSV